MQASVNHLKSRSLLKAMAVAPALLLAGCGDEGVITLSSQREAIRTAALLEAQQVEVASIESTGDQRRPAFTIRVPSHGVADARRILAYYGLPRPTDDGFLALSESAGLVPSRAEDRLRLIAALTEQLRSELLRLPDVVDASVMLSVPEESMLRTGASAQQKVGASVVIQTVKHAAPRAVTPEPGVLSSVGLVFRSKEEIASSIGSASVAASSAPLDYTAIVRQYLSGLGYEVAGVEVQTADVSANYLPPDAGLAYASRVKSAGVRTIFIIAGAVAAVVAIFWAMTLRRNADRTDAE